MRLVDRRNDLPVGHRTAHAFDGLDPLNRLATVAGMVDAVDDYAGSTALRTELLKASRLPFARCSTTTRNQCDALVDSSRQTR